MDGAWKYAPEQPAMYDERGNVNNVVEVCEYTPENLENLHSFAPPSSPPHSYDCTPSTPDDFTKEPPAAPPQAGVAAPDAASSTSAVLLDAAEAAASAAAARRAARVTAWVRPATSRDVRPVQAPLTAPKRPWWRLLSRRST